MADQVQWRRGNSAQIAAIAGVQGEVFVNTDNYRLVTNDGATLGGFSHALLSDIVAIGGTFSTILPGTLGMFIGTTITAGGVLVPQ